MSTQTPTPEPTSPTQVLVNLAAAGYRPAALIGSWFGYSAIIAPDLSVAPTAPGDLFPTNSPGASTDEWFFGVRPYSGVSFGGSTRSVLLFDGEAWHLNNIDTDIAKHAFSPIADATAATTTAATTITWDNGNEAAHRDGVEACKEAIAAGEVYQTCISTRFFGEVDTVRGTASNDEVRLGQRDVIAHAAAWFAAKVAQFNPDKAAFIPGCIEANLPTVASLSPEEFLIRDGDTITESPIKGTLPISDDPALLRASTKDVAENIMIVDLVRHDLGQIATTGGVRVTDLLSVLPAPGVWHLVSTVQATIPTELPHADVVEACFPPASVTGTPKRRAWQLLQSWEPVDRGVHCGCIGASTSQKMELNVAIRTAEFFLRNAPDSAQPTINVEAGIGGGITIDSTPAEEWAEIQSKFAPLMRRSRAIFNAN